MTSRQDGDYSDYSNFSNQTGNTFGMSNQNTHNVVPVPQNVTFECYIPLPNGRIYYITYTELHQLEIARLLNNRLTHVPDDQRLHHHNIQSFIQQQFLQPPVDYQQNNVQQQCTQPIPQVYSDDNASIPSNEAISADEIQDTGYNGIQGNNNAQ